MQGANLGEDSGVPDSHTSQQGQGLSTWYKFLAYLTAMEPVGPLSHCLLERRQGVGVFSPMSQAPQL